MRNTMIGALIAGIIALLIGLGIGFVFRNVQLKSAQADSQSLIEQAERKANELTKQAKVEAEILKKEAENLEKEKILALKEEGQKRRESIENEFIETRTELKASEKRLKQREEILDRKDDTLTRKEQSLDSKEENLSNKTNTLSKREEALSQIEAEKAAELARIASLSHDEAKEIILTQTKGSLSKEMAQLIRASEEKATAEADKKAKNIITLAILPEISSVLFDAVYANPLEATYLNGHDTRLVSLAFSADGEQMASVDKNGMLMLWDVARRQPIT